MGNIQKKMGLYFIKAFMIQSMRLMNQCSLRFIRHLPSMV